MSRKMHNNYTTDSGRRRGAGPLAFLTMPRLLLLAAVFTVCSVPFPSGMKAWASEVEITSDKIPHGKTGKKLNVPIDDFNHLMDAMRYAMEDFSMGDAFSFE